MAVSIDPSISERKLTCLYLVIAVNILIFVSAWIVASFSVSGTSETNRLMPFLCLSSSPAALALHPWTPVSYMLTHFDPLHILFNMIWLIFFGKVMIRKSGVNNFLISYIGGGLCGALCFLCFASVLPGFTASNFLCGSSAAVLSVVTATALTSPDHNVIFPFIPDVKLKWIALVCIALAFSGFIATSQSAISPHLGGILFGAFLILLIKVNKARRIHILSLSSRNSIRQNDKDNLILQKIRTSGYCSLTTREREQLSR